MRTVGVFLVLAAILNVACGSELSPNPEKDSDNLDKSERTVKPRSRNSPRYHLRMATEADKDAPRKNLLRSHSLGVHEQRILELREILNRVRAEKEVMAKSENDLGGLTDKLDGLGLN